MEVEINGITYRQKVQQKSKPMSKTLSTILVMAGMYGGLGYEKKTDTPNVDIVKEYELIQLKKSQLSKSQRDWVVIQFKKNFEPITM